jgi:hypothetical protein
MDEKISLEAIALYGDAYADNVLKRFFTSNEKITGQEILSLCNVQQVNLFVVRELFKAWKEETRRLKSPYFDYEHPEVKEALDNFINIISQHISIQRAHFAPLLKKATSQALMVIFDPYDFYSLIITGKNNKLEVDSFREEIKYLKINKAPLEGMLQKLEEKGIKEISGNEAFATLDVILEEVNFTPEDVEQYLEKFSAIVPLDPASFYVQRTPEPEKKPVAVQKEPVPPKPEPIRVNQPKANVQQPVQNNDKPNRPAQSPVNNLQKIAKIKDSLTINQKFMFTKVLFHGDFDLFSKAIERLDQFDNLNAALRYIDDEYASTWDNDSEEFHEFMELVERRFA